MSEDVGIEPRTLPTSALTIRRSNHAARSHPPTRLDLLHTRLDLVHTRLDLVHTRLDLIHNLAKTLESTLLGSIPASSDTVESEGRQRKHC